MDMEGGREFKGDQSKPYGLLYGFNRIFSITADVIFKLKE